MTPSDYEAACERFNQANAAAPLARAEAARIVQAAEDEWNAARANLARHEVSPGIPLPECDPYRTEEPEPGGATSAWEHHRHG